MPSLPAAARVPLLAGAAIWLAALAVAAATTGSVAARGGGAVGVGVAVAAIALGAIVHRCSAPPAPGQVAAPPPARARLALDVAWILAIAVVTGWEGMFASHQSGPPDLRLWTGLRWFALAQSEALGLGGYDRVLNPIACIALPLLVVLPSTGVRHLGIRRGHRALLVAAVTCAAPLAAIVALAAMRADAGAAVFAQVPALALANTLSNGPCEEFLFRGLLQTRLALWCGEAWGLLLASVSFGVWHVGANAVATSGALLPALADGVLVQGVVGALLGFVYLRTRNLLAPSLLHVAINVAYQAYQMPG